MAALPAYDLNPNNEPYTRRAHTLAFLPGENKPSLELCREMIPYFNLDKKQVDHGLKAIGTALKSWKTLAKSNGLTDNEIQRKADAFEHEDSMRLVAGVQKQSRGMKR